MLCGCRDYLDKRIAIHIENNSDHSIQTYKILSDISGDKVYPDTSIVRKETGIVVKQKTSADIGFNGNDIQEQFKYFPKDTLSFFVFDADTVAKYPWDSIRSKYLVSARYDLSAQDIINRKYRIEYPYDPKLGKLKVYQKK